MEQYTPPSIRRLLRNRKFNPNYANAAIVVENDETEPENFEEAFQNPKWIKATKEEIDALELNQTWELVVKPIDVKPISCK